MIVSLRTKLNHRFSSESYELLGKIPYLDLDSNVEPYHLNHSGIVELVVMYKDDFTATNLVALQTDIREFVLFVDEKENTSVFGALESNLGQFCVAFCKHNLESLFPQLFKLIRLVLTLPISTATTECAFSPLKILTTRLRTSIGDDWMVDQMIINIKNTIAKALDRNDILFFHGDVSGSMSPILSIRNQF